MEWSRWLEKLRNANSVREVCGDITPVLTVKAVINYAMECTGSARQAKLLVQLWGLQACELFDAAKVWEAVERVASQLIQQRTLKFDECRRLVFLTPPDPTLRHHGRSQAGKHAAGG